ncbi:FlgD immunoglobulin-like domain containing protein [Candidatus Latescibacterota bacterium]
MMYRKYTLALVVAAMLPASAGAQDPAVFAAGDLWDSFLPTNVGKTYNEVETDPNQLYYLIRIGNHDRQWTTPTLMYPGGENLHIPWKQAIEMIEYSPGINFFTTSGDPRASDYVYGFHTPNLNGADRAYADEATSWVDPAKRHQLIFEGLTPTNLGIDVRYRIRQWTLNHANMNDFIAVELELTNTGVLDADGDGTPESTSNRINCLVLNLRHELINSMTNNSFGRRGSAGWFTGPISGYDATSDPDGYPWDVPLTFSGPSPSSLTITGPDGVPWAPDGGRLLGNTMNSRRHYYDIYTGAQWLAAKEGSMPSLGSSASQLDKKTIYDSHPVGVGSQRGWFTSMSKGYGSDDHNAWENHTLSMGAFYENGGRVWDRYGLLLTPDPNWFDVSHPDIIAGSPLSFVNAVRPEGGRGQPRGDMKYNQAFSQNWEKGNPGVLSDGSDSDWDEGYAIAHGFDGDMYVGIGPFSLEVGETFNLLLVEYAGFRLQGVRRARKAAQWAYDNGWQLPEPPPTPDMKIEELPPPADRSRATTGCVVKWDDRAETSPDFAGYKIYRTVLWPYVDSRQLGIRLVDRYHEQTVENPTDAQLAAFGVPNNPNISSEGYLVQTPAAWGPYRLLKTIPSSELSAHLNPDTDNAAYRYRFEDPTYGVTHWYYVAAYDVESGEINGQPFSSLETHRHNYNGRSGLWEGTYSYAMASANFPNRDDAAGMKRIGAPISPPGVIAGDTNNDIYRDARDLLPIGLYWQETGPYFPDATTNANVPRPFPYWVVEPAARADADGNGVVNEEDILPIAQNWLAPSVGPMSIGKPVGQGEALSADIALAMLGALDRAPESEWARALRHALEGMLAPSTVLPLQWSLHQNTPNPFNPTTTIRYAVPGGAEAKAVHLRIYNAAGQQVRTLVEGPVEPGVHTVGWDGRDEGGRPVASGVYLCRLAANKHESVRRMLLLR